MRHIQSEVGTTGGREKAVPNAVDFVFPRRPAGLDPRPQSSFISSESQSSPVSLQQVLRPARVHAVVQPASQGCG